MRARGTSGSLPPGIPDQSLWQHRREMDAAPDETERFLDLAGFADGRLDDDERERIAALIAGDPLAAADVGAARTLSEAAIPAASGGVLARAAALIDPVQIGGEILTFPQRSPPSRLWPAAASWGSLAAAIAFACWLGFDLGRDLPGLASIAHPSDDLGASELMEPAPLALRDAPEGSSI